MKKRIVAALMATFLMFPLLGTVAYAGGADPDQQQSEVPSVEETTPTPLTPDGTGTVVDHVTDEDGKEFYTIVTADGNYFYLIIDHQRDTENVYFLNVVTEDDLLALAEPSESVSSAPDPEPAPVPVPAPKSEPTPEPEPAPEKSSNMGMLLLILLIVVGGGGAAYYFKIYRPKQEQAGMEEDYDDYEEDEAEDDRYWPGDEDAPPWDEDGDE